MILQLIHALQALAAPAEIQLARFPDFVVKADELALDFDDALRRAGRPGNHLSPAQRTALARVDEFLTRMSGAANAPKWTDAAVQSSPEWVAVRALAADALRALGAPVEPPPPSDAVFVPGLHRRAP
jgi:hypothetical protein